ncbi:MAG: 2-dehydro-3-deoxygalactonokinase [Sphingomonas sp.]|nr:2-dehydro-3-deoxygalactonokinase [Sphingomonas sp.]
MSWAEGFIAVDWGTTNRRAYRVAADGSCVEELEDGKGILSVKSEEFEGAVSEIRDRLGEGPMLLAGMVGSNRGWVEAPYVSCPAGLDELAGGLVWTDDKTAIVPGVAYSADRSDVMRGEEVQILGAAASGEIPADCLVCHPGTHNKWVLVENSRIQSFRTVMTGELFNLLRKHSILSDSLDTDEMYDAPFRAGVREGLSGNALTSELFSVRASVLLGRLDKAHAVSFTSGLLIGYDVCAGVSGKSAEPLIVMGRPELTTLYSKALEEAGVESRQIDGEGAFLAGARKIAERIR